MKHTQTVYTIDDLLATRFYIGYSEERLRRELFTSCDFATSTELLNNAHIPADIRMRFGIAILPERARMEFADWCATSVMHLMDPVPDSINEYYTRGKSWLKSNAHEIALYVAYGSWLRAGTQVVDEDDRAAGFAAWAVAWAISSETYETDAISVAEAARAADPEMEARQLARLAEMIQETGV